MEIVSIFGKEVRQVRGIGNVICRDFFDFLSQRGVAVRKAAEIGVLSYDASSLKGFSRAGVECHLYEAVPEFCKQIFEATRHLKNVHLHSFAVSDFAGEMELCIAGASTFQSSLTASPAINHDGFDKSSPSATFIKVPCRDFAEVDPGDLDFLSIDIEGGEFSVLSRMVSRPVVLSIETQSRGYVNPRLGAITDWMVSENYAVWFQNDTDTVFVRGKRPSLGFLEDLKARAHSFRYFANRI